MTKSEAQTFRNAVDLAVGNITSDESKLKVEPLIKGWHRGKHTVGEIYMVDGQMWGCYQSYANAVYPDINPSGSAWRTFNRPLHGKSLATAKPFVHPTGSHDIYKSGEYAVWTDGRIYKCISDTAFSPAEYSQAWQKIN